MKTLIDKDFREMNWKNGKGRTLELLRLPHPKDSELFSLRLSIASMKESGPFSHYPGIERSIILLEGKGVVLDFVDEIKMHLNEPLKPIQFPGEAEIEAKLIDGPIREFNIMAARDCIEAYIKVHHKVPKIQLGGQDEHYCYVVEKNELIVLGPGEKFDLNAKEGLTIIDVQVKKKKAP